MAVSAAGPGNTAGEGIADALARAIAMPGPGEGPMRFAFDDALDLFGGDLLIEADPAEFDRQMSYRIDPGGGTLSPSEFFVGDGDWSGWLVPLDSFRVMRELRELIAAGLDYRRTRRYAACRRAMDEGRVPHFHHANFDTPEKLDAYFVNFCRMIAAAERYGILPRPMARLDDDPGHYPTNAVRPLWLELSERNIGVAIGSDGTLVRLGPGKHRVAVAQLLALPSVPCEVRLIHADLLRRHLRDARGDALAAVRHCLAEVRQQRQPGIAAKRRHQLAEAEQPLDRALGSAAARQGNFFFPRKRVPPVIGAQLLMEAGPAMIRGSIEAPDGLFLGQGDWRSRIEAFPVMEACRPPAGQVPARPPISILAEPPIPVAIAADGGLLVLAAARDRLIASRTQGEARILADVSLIHVDALKRAALPADATRWDAVLRCARAEPAAMPVPVVERPAGGLPFGKVLHQTMRAIGAQAQPFFLSQIQAADALGDTLLVEVDPRVIGLQLAARVKQGSHTIQVTDHFLGKGDWTRWLKPIETLQVDEEVRDVIAHGDDFRATESYRRMLEQIAAGRATTRSLIALDSTALVDAYFGDLVNLIASIRHKGIVRRPTRGLADLRSVAPSLSIARPLLVEMAESDIGLAVGADGALFRIGPGHHRMSIARRLGLARVPAELQLFHVKWLRQIMREEGLGPLAALRHGIARLALHSPSSTPDRRVHDEPSGETP